MDKTLDQMVSEAQLHNAYVTIAMEILRQAAEEDITDYDEILNCIFDPVLDNVRLEIDNALFRHIETQKAAS